MLIGSWADLFTTPKSLANDILKFAGITLVVGAGGGFGQILRDSGVSNAIIGVANEAHLSPLLLGWVVAVMIRIATGSATVP